jgi:nitric oxide reductase NorE protein
VTPESSSDTLGAQTRAKGFLPGDDGLWFFICAEITLFGLLFGAFLSARSEAPDVFRDAQRLMVPLFAFLNTTYLLTSSWLVALSVQIARDDRLPTARRCIDLARVLGLLFVATKAVEYWHEVDVGANPGNNTFFMFYFVTTGIHLGHVIGGLVLLTFVRTRLKESIAREDRLLWIESGATFWHMVDLLWLIILALYYLLP